MAKEYKEYGALGKPKSELEEEIAERIYPQLTEADIERINKDKLTLGGCVDKCMQNGHKYEVKSGKGGIARITPEQHWKWVSEYFGVKVDPESSVPVAAPVEQEQVKPEPVDDTLSALLDF